MQHKLLRSRKVIGMLALLATWMGVGTFGCIPAFRGFQPVTVEDLKPKKKSEAPAEILMMNNYYRDRWGQVGSERLAVFWRHHSRIRYNKRASFSSAKWVLIGNLLDLELRTACADGRVLQMTAADIQQDTQFVNNQRVYSFAAPGLDEGCIVDVMWEMDVAGVPSYPLLQEFPIQKAHFRYDYNADAIRRVDLFNTEYLWIQLAAKKAQSKQGKKANGSATQPKTASASPKAKDLSADEKNAHVRLGHDRQQRRVELWLNDLPATQAEFFVPPPNPFPRPPNPKAVPFLQANLLPPRYAHPASLNIQIIKTLGIESREIWLSWRNVEDEFISPSNIFSETRTPQQRSYQMDEEEELKAEALPAIARRITANTSTHREKVAAIYHHLRQRMFVTSPTNTSSVYRLDKVYALTHGNTYEINMLMVIMLRSLGIRAYLALAAPGKFAKYLDREPKNYFGSFVTYLPDDTEGKWRGMKEEVQAGREFLASKGADYAGGRIVNTGMVLDPSEKGMPLGMLSSALSNTWVFVMDRSGGRFFQTPDVDEKKNMQHVHIRATVAIDGSAQGTLTRSLWGQDAAALRNVFANTPKHKWPTGVIGGLIRTMCGQHATVTVEEAPNLALATLSEPLRYSYRFQTTSCIHHGSRHLLLPLIPTKRLRVPQLQAPVRLAPIYLGVPSTHKADVELTFPAGYRVWSAVPAQVTASGPGISLRVDLATTQNKMTYKTEMRRIRRELPASEYPTVRAFYEKLHNLSKTVVLVGQRR